jgi:hypothetical protein
MDKDKKPNPAPAFDPTTLGFNSLEELKAFVESQRKKEGDFTKILEAKEKEFQKKLEAYEKKLSELQAQLQEKEQALQQKEGELKNLVITNTLTKVAAEKGVLDPEVFLALVSGKAELTEDGKVVIEGKDPSEFVESLKEQKPFLFKASEKEGSGAGSNPAPASQKEELLKKYEEAKKNGDIDTALSLKAELAKLELAETQKE